MRRTLGDLLSSQRVGVLATQCEGQPHCNLVAYSFTERLDLLFATPRATRKYENLAADDRVSVLIDNRSDDDLDFKGAIAATVTGRALEVTGKERESLRNIYLAKHPQLGDFLAEPTTAFMKVEVDTYYLVSKFQDVMKLHIRKRDP